MTVIAKNIILIGMPGAGKSTLGILLAKQLGMDFVDTDILIQVAYGKTLQQIINEFDYLRLREYEEQVLIDLDCSGSVIATGGSAVYSEPGMLQLKTNAQTVFLDLDLKQLTQRVDDFDHRGIARRNDQSFADLYAERRPLYQKYADISIDCNYLDIEQSLLAITKKLNNQ